MVLLIHKRVFLMNLGIVLLLDWLRKNQNFGNFWLIMINYIKMSKLIGIFLLIQKNQKKKINNNKDQEDKCHKWTWLKCKEWCKICNNKEKCHKCHKKKMIINMEKIVIMMMIKMNLILMIKKCQIWMIWKSKIKIKNLIN